MKEYPEIPSYAELRYRHELTKSSVAKSDAEVLGAYKFRKAFADPLAAIALKRKYGKPLTEEEQELVMSYEANGISIEEAALKNVVYQRNARARVSTDEYNSYNQGLEVGQGLMDSGVSDDVLMRLADTAYKQYADAKGSQVLHQHNGDLSDMLEYNIMHGINEHEDNKRIKDKTGKMRFGEGLRDSVGISDTDND